MGVIILPPILTHHLPVKGIILQRLSSTKVRLPPMVVFHQRSSSTEGCLSFRPPFTHVFDSPQRNCLPERQYYSLCQKTRELDDHILLSNIFKPGTKTDMEFNVFFMSGTNVSLTKLSLYPPSVNNQLF